MSILFFLKRQPCYFIKQAIRTYFYKLIKTTVMITVNVEITFSKENFMKICMIPVLRIMNQNSFRQHFFGESFVKLFISFYQFFSIPRPTVDSV